MSKSRKTVYTTGEAARLCQVACRTIAKWFDTGKIDGYRVPLTQSRRIYRDNLHRFMLLHGMVEAVRPITSQAVLASNDPHLIGTLRRSLEPHWGVRSASSWFELGLIASDRLEAVVLDFSFGARTDVLSAVRWFAGRTPKPRIVAILNEDEGDPREVLSAGVELAHVRPADAGWLALALEPKVSNER